MRRWLATLAFLPIFATTTGAHAQVCPIAMPVPADEPVLDCKTDQQPSRCGVALSNAQCQSHNQLASSQGLVTPGGHDWLLANGFCAISIAGIGVISVCPAACPIALPTPAGKAMVACKAEANIDLCSTRLPNEECQNHNTRALDLGLLTPSAYDWLVENGYCAVNPLGLSSIITVCPVGCFEENTAILTVSESGAEEWLAAKHITMTHRLFSVNDDASLSSPQLSGRAIERMSIGPEVPDLYVFAMSNGHKLRVTTHHPMVLFNGQVVAAKDVVTGDFFIGPDGSIIEVEGIGREPTSADVYNFAVAGDTPQEHIIAAEGVLVGDLTWQSMLAGELESLRLRR